MARYYWHHMYDYKKGPQSAYTSHKEAKADADKINKKLEKEGSHLRVFVSEQIDYD